MKQIMLVGKFNTTVQNVKKILDKEYRVQLTSENVEMVIGMLKMDVPDCILIFTADMEDMHRDIFSHIQENYPGVPVVYVGTKQELAAFEDFETAEQFFKLVRPVQMNMILQAIAQRISGKTEEEAMKGELDTGLPENKKKVLIIDDSRIQRNMMQSLLKGKYEVSAAQSGKEGLRMMETWLPDLILLDYDMPDCDGREVFTMLQTEERYCHIPVVFLTGVKERKKIQEVIGLMPTGYLLKPVQQKRLMDLLEEFLG